MHTDVDKSSSQNWEPSLGYVGSSPRCKSNVLVWGSGSHHTYSRRIWQDHVLFISSVQILRLSPTARCAPLPDKSPVNITAEKGTRSDTIKDLHAILFTWRENLIIFRRVETSSKSTRKRRIPFDFYQGQEGISDTLCFIDNNDKSSARRASAAMLDYN